MRAAVAARLARRPPQAEAAAAPVEREDDDGDEEITDATFDERMRAKVLLLMLYPELQPKQPSCGLFRTVQHGVASRESNICSGDSQQCQRASELAPPVGAVS